MKALLSALFMLSLQTGSLIAQSTLPAPEQPEHQSTPAKPEAADTGEEPDEAIATPAPPKPRTVPENVDLAWQMLEEGAALGKVQLRIDTVNAVGTMPMSPRVVTIVTSTMKDSERDVRLATVVAMLSLKGPKITALLHQALSDKALDVSFAAATVLWKRGDRAGEDIITGVLLGHRKANAGFIGEGLHNADRDLHNPAALGAIGAEQGAYALLGPFGIGLDAFKIMRGKGPSGNSARVVAAGLLAKDAKPDSRADFLATVTDKDYFVRIASAKALASYHGKDVNDALVNAFTDPKPAVRYVAAASYIRANSPRSSKPAPAAAPPA
jgi:hypothetical protein